MIFVELMFIECLMLNTYEVKKHLENEKQNEMNTPEGLFQEPIGNEIKKI